MFERILVPLDGSRLAEVALEQAAELAKRFDSRLLLLQVLPLDLAPSLAGTGLAGNEIGAPDSPEQRYETEESSASAYLGHIVTQLAANGIAADAQEMRGDPAEAILEYAHSSNATMIVMSSHGRSGLARVVFGSVAQKVLHECRLPVLVLRSLAATAA